MAGHRRGVYYKFDRAISHREHLGSQEPGGRGQESGVRNQGPEVRSQQGAGAKSLKPECQIPDREFPTHRVMTEP
jgi:hypothetical protein